MRMWRDKRGSIAVEFALVGTMLPFLFIAATDLALAIRARAEVGNAARAGAEYAAINGWNTSGILTGVTSATSLTNVTATATTFCGCATGSGITQQTCGTASAAGGTIGTYASLTAEANYSPLFPTAWNPYLVNNFVKMSATVVTRTQ